MRASGPSIIDGIAAILMYVLIYGTSIETMKKEGAP